MKKLYFVSYCYKQNHGSLYHSNAQLELDPVTGIESINEMSDIIKSLKPGATNVVILNWRPFEGQD